MSVPRRNSISLRRDPHRRGGFTILEVLVSLAIFAMAAIVLASAYLNIINGYEIIQRGSETNADIEFARSLVLTEPDRKKLEKGGQFDTAEGRHVNWSVDIASTSMPELYTVTFTCEVGEPGHDAEKTVQTFTLLRPTWTVDPAEHDKLREEAKTRILELQGKQNT
jgi:general secretion pathway protein I